MVDVTVLVEALKALQPTSPANPSHTEFFTGHQGTNTMTFKLFVKSVNSWFLLQGIPTTAKVNGAEVENPIRLDYVL